MAKYRYKKYASVLNYSRDNESSFANWGNWIYVRPPVYDLGNAWNYPEDHLSGSQLKCDLLTGYYIEGYSEVSGSDRLYIAHDYAMIESPSHVILFTGNGFTLSDSNTSNGGRTTHEYKITPTQGKGDYIGEVTAEDGAYPDNGYNSADGCWYVKDRKATNMLIKSGGVWLDAEPGCRVGGVWRSCESYARVGGVWRT